MARRLTFVLLIAILTLGQAAAPPTLTPAQGTAGTVVEVTVNAPLSPNGAVGFEPPGSLNATNLRSSPDGALQFTLEIAANAPAVSFAFVYTPPPGGRATAPLRVPSAFTVLQAPVRVVVPQVRIRSINPAEVEAGAPPVAMEIAGTGFKDGAQVSFSGTGVSASPAQVNRAGDALVTSVSALASAAPVPRNVVVTNPDGTSNSDQVPAVQLGVKAAPPPRASPPRVTAVAPAQLTIGGSAAMMRIEGTGFAQGALVALAGVTVNVVSVADALIVVQAAAAPSASPGAVPIVVTNPDGQSNANQQPPVTIALVAPPPPAPIVPVVASVAPPSMEIGDVATTLQIAGSNFAQGATVAIGPVSVVVLSVAPDSIVARASAPAGTQPGDIPILVTNPDGQSNANQRTPVHLTLVAPPPRPQAPMAPVVTSVTPPSMEIGDVAVTLQITGANFAQGATVTIGMIPVVVESATADWIIARATTPPGTLPGDVPILVTNPDGRSNANQRTPVLFGLRAGRPAAPPPTPEKKPPVVHSITPDRSRIGGPAVMLQIQGQNFKPGASLSIAGLSASVISVSPDGAMLVARAELVPSAAPGSSPVIVGNPDGLSNAAQSPPVLFTIEAETTGRKPPIAPPARPPAEPPVKPPEVTKPPVEPPVKPPETATPPVAVKPPVEPPPTEILIKPRIDLVSPNQLSPGQKYSLDLQGKNLSPDTQISFGKNVTIVGAPFITSPTAAKVEILVSPTATPGAIAASAANSKGSSSGPGGVFIVAGGTKAAPPAEPKAPVPVAKAKFKQPQGKIVLDAPCDPDQLFSKECEQPVTLNDSTLFVWHELNPGIAKFFVFEIADAEGTVIFSAQTNKKYYRLSAANLASLPHVVPQPYKVQAGVKNASTSGAPTGAAASKAPASKPDVSAATAQMKGTGGGAKTNYANLAPGDTKGLTNAMQNAEATTAEANLAFSKRTPAPAEVYWRVKGMANKIDEILGTKLPEMIQAEDSPDRAIVLPLPPNGFSCEGGTTGSKIGAFVPTQFKPSPLYAKRPKPCPDKSMNICSDADSAMFSPDAKLDLTRVPFNIRQVGELNSSQEVVFQNVFVDWGDGSEPKPLKVKGKLTKGQQSLKALKLIAPGNDDNARLQHRYENEDPDAEFVTYKVRIFSVYDADETPVYQVSEATKSEAVASGSLTALGLGSQAVPAATPKSATSKGSAAASGATNTSGAGAAQASTATNTAGAGAKTASFVSKMFTIACADVQVWNPWGVGADEPIHLLTAHILFPTDSAETKALIKELKGQQGAAMTSPAASAAGTAKGPGSGEKVQQQTQPQATVAKAGAKTTPAKAGAKTSAPSGQQVGIKSPAGLGEDLPSLTIPEISDCSSAFKAAAQITYWGVGKIKVYWYVDGVLVESQALPNELPRVSTADGEAGKKPYVLTMVSALPAVLQASPHRVQVRVEVVKPPLILFESGTSVASKQQPGGSSGASVKLGPTQQSYTHVNQKVKKGQSPSSAKGPGAGAAVIGTGEQSLNTFTIVPDPLDEPGDRVESFVRYYAVFDHKARGLPCVIRYATAETGTFEISDLTALKRAVDGSFSGAGMLKLHFPSHDGSSISLQPVSVSFTKWQLVQESQEDEDTLVVEAGSYEQSVDASLSALSFPLELKKVGLTPARLAIDGNVRLANGTGFTNATVEELPHWDFVSTPLTSEGDFRFTKAAPVETELGASKFVLKIASAEIDFSKTEGAAPTQPCAPVSTDVAWQGIRVDGSLEAPDTLQIANIPILKNYPFTGWGIGPAGLSVNFSDPSYTKQISKSGVQVAAKGFNFKHCNGTFGAPSFGLEISNAPLIVQKISGTISLDEFAQLHPSFPSISVEHDWGNVRTKITDASFGFSPEVANFAITIKSHFWFEVNDKPSYDSAYDGVLITLDGNVFAADGSHYFAVPGAATANIAGYPMQVTSLGVGNNDTGDIWFGFRGDIEPGEMAPAVKDREAKYLLTKTSAAELAFPGAAYQVVSLDSSAFGTEQDFGYSTGSAGGVTVQQIHLDFSYPPSSKTVQVTADCMWHQDGDSYFFIGEGQVKVLDSFGVEIGALFGRELNDSYWLVKASVDFPTMIAFGSTGLGMDRIHGGLGYSVPISAFDMPELIQVKTDKSKAYLFSAGIGVGTMDAFTLYADGTLTVKLSGPDAGVRLSVGAWLLNSEHAKPPLAEACMQYAGGAFDAGMTMHLELGGGLAVIDAPKSGPDICTQAAVQVHFGGSEDWHIWIGQKSLPLNAKLLIIDGLGYLMIDGQGVEMFNGIYIDKKWTASIAGFSGWVKVWGAVEINGVMTYAPFHISGALAGAISAAAGADVAGGCCSVGFGVSLKFAAAAPPVEVCGKVGVHFSTPWPLPDVNASVGPLCLGG